MYSSVRYVLLVMRYTYLIILVFSPNKSMYKKSMMVMLALLGMATAVSTYAQTGEKKEPTIQVDAFNNLRVRHCDEWVESDKLATKRSMTLDWDEQKTLCNVFINDSEYDITVKYSYVEATIGNSWMPNCSINGGKFAALISPSGPLSFVVPAKSHIVREDKMFLPPGMEAGVMRGCLWYGIESIKWVNNTSTSMFKIENRKVILYEVLVGWASSIKNAVSWERAQSDVFITNKKIKVQKTEEWIIVSATIKNDSNVDQIINLTGKIYNFLWFEKEFAIKDKKIWPFQTVELPTTIEVIPTYKWIFDVKISVSYIPSLAFEWFDLPEEITKWGNFYETAKIFIFSRYALGVIVIILLVLRSIIKSILPKKKADTIVTK